MTKPALFSLVLAAGMMLAACGGTASTPASVMAVGHEGQEAQVVSVWRSKCGACHVPVEPGSRQRVVIEKAMQRHRKRLRLTDDQWTQLVDFLAPPQTQASAQ